jgi:magnesium transporter
MNFEHIPELGWSHGYAFALTLMLGTCVVLCLLFRHRDWL